LYYNDNQTYPLDLSVDLTDYIKVMPEYDTYTPDLDGESFTVKVALENLSDPDLAASQTRCLGSPDTSEDYVVCAD
jgi:hypothetical protein